MSDIKYAQRKSLEVDKHLPYNGWVYQRFKIYRE